MGTRSEGDGTVGVAIIDCQPVVQRGLASILSAEKHLRVCGQAHSVGEAMAMIQQTSPEVVIMDLSIGSGTGLDLIGQMIKAKPGLRILALTMWDAEVYAERAFRSGARGFLRKDSTAQEIVEAVTTVAQGRIYASQTVTCQIISRVACIEEANGEIARLSDREVAVLEMIGAGQPTRRIAQALHISPKTVDSHREHIKAKLQLADGTELNEFAIAWVSEHCRD